MDRSPARLAAAIDAAAASAAQGRRAARPLPARRRGLLLGQASVVLNNAADYTAETDLDAEDAAAALGSAVEALDLFARAAFGRPAAGPARARRPARFSSPEGGAAFRAGARAQANDLLRVLATHGAGRGERGLYAAAYLLELARDLMLIGSRC